MFSCCHPLNKLKFIDDSFCWRHEATFSSQRKLTREVTVDILNHLLHKTARALNSHQIKNWLHPWGSHAQTCSRPSRTLLSSALCGTYREQPCKQLQSLPSLCFASKKSKDNHTCFHGLFASHPFKGCRQSCLSRRAVASDRPRIMGS